MFRACVGGCGLTWTLFSTVRLPSMYVSGEARDVVEGLLEGARGVNVKYIVVNGAETEYSPCNLALTPYCILSDRASSDDFEATPGSENEKKKEILVIT